MADSKENGSMDSISPDDDLLMEDMDFDDLSGLEEAVQESDRALPRKVELDIDDMLLEEEDIPETEEPEEKPGEEPEAAEEEPEEEPEAEPEEETEEKPGRVSRTKLFLVAGGVLGLAVMVAVVAIVLLANNTRKISAVPAGPATIELAPFIINFSEEKEEVIAEFILSVTFVTPQAKSDFEKRSVYVRDLIYRYVQGQGPGVLGDVAAKKEMVLGLRQLFDQSLKSGLVTKIKILSLRQV